MGRKSTYTQALADLICDRIANGESLRTICLDADMPGTTAVMKWLNEHASFAQQYARARESQADKMAEEILQIADESARDTYIDANGKEMTDHEVVARSRLRVDARKWLASKMAPKKYGDKLALGGADDLPAIGITKIERVIIKK